MRLFVTADLHYDVGRSVSPTHRLVDELRAAEPAPDDVLVLVGDTAGADLDRMRDALRLFADFPGRKALTAGNHELWCPPGESNPDSLARLERDLPVLARQEGFTLLDDAPLVVGRLGLVGSVGWYDYSMRDERLGVPEAFYREKISPGAARYYGGYDALLGKHTEDLTERHMAMGARWMDGWRTNLGMDDEAFLARCNQRLAEHLADVAPRTDRIAAFVHHLPFPELLPPRRRNEKPMPDRLRFALAYMGSAATGKVLRACSRVRWVFCGHSHWPTESKLDTIQAINIGSTYIHKRLCIVEAGQ